MFEIKTWQQRALELTRLPSGEQAYALLQAEIDDLRAALQPTAMSEQQVADMLRDPEILIDIGYRALLNGDPIDADLPWLTRVVNRALRSQPKGEAQ